MKYCWMLWPESWRGSCIFTSFHFPDSGLFLLNGFDFYFDLFWKAWYWKPAIKKQRKVVLATYGRFCDESVHYWPVKIKLKYSRFFFGHCTVIIYFFYFFSTLLDLTAWPCSLCICGEKTSFWFSTTSFSYIEDRIAQEHQPESCVLWGMYTTAYSSRKQACYTPTLKSLPHKDWIKFSSWLTRRIVGKIVCGMIYL